MATCSSCGLEIPDGQGSSCSMCYGDIAYGNDGYYRLLMEDMERQSREKEDEEIEGKG